MSIKAYVDELARVQTEIRRNNDRNRLLRARVKELELNIGEYLSSKGQPGLKYNGQAILLQSQEKRTIKKKKDKESSVITLLGEMGVDNPESAYSRIVDVQRNDPISETKLKFTRLKKTKALI
jgi:hypothetical protein